MFQKLLAAALVGALAVGVAQASEPIEPFPVTPVDCTEHCPPTLQLSNGTFCVLAGCLAFNDQVICAYNCFFPLPPYPPLF